MTQAVRNSRTNKVEFYRNGVQVFDFTTSGNIVEFANGELILL